MRRGSRGSGFCVESGVRSRALTEGRRAGGTGGAVGLPFALEVRDNGVLVEEPDATRAALRELVRRAGRGARVPAALALDNRYDLPLGAGLGVSGACALAGVLAANEAMGLGVDRSDCVASAHCGEVEALTGLGDVVAAAIGGFEMRTREGGPPHGEVLTFPAPDAEVLIASFGPRPTRAFLSATRSPDRLNATGLACLEALRASPSLEASVRLGRSFAETLGFVSPAASALLRRLDPVAPASVAMLGDTVFALGGQGLEDLVRRHAPRAFMARTRVTAQGARVL